MAARPICFATFLILFFATNIKAQDSVFPIVRPKLIDPSTDKITSAGLTTRIYQFSTPFPTELVATPRETLETMGVSFSTNCSSASFDAKTNQLKVTLPSDQVELVDNSLYDLLGASVKQISVRFEVYEMPTVTAISIIESCDASVNNASPQRAALIKMVGTKNVELSFFTAITSSNLSRSEAEDDLGYVLAVGTMFDGRNAWVELSYFFQYLTNKIIANNVKVAPGNYCLVGSWPVSQSQNGDRMQLVFLHTAIQNVNE